MSVSYTHLSVQLDGEAYFEITRDSLKPVSYTHLLLPSLAGGHHTAYLTERGLVGADAHGWRQVDLFSATGYLSAGYGFGGVPLDRLDEGSSLSLIHI